MKKEKNYWTKEDDLLLTHIPYNGQSTKSPHILINKWFHRLKKNYIVLKTPREIGEMKKRKIYYEIDFMGENIKYSRMNNYINLQLKNTLQKWILVLVKFKDIMSNPKLCFFTETGFLIKDEEIDWNKKGYVVLAAIKHDNKFTSKQESFSPDKISLRKKFFYNVAKVNSL